MIAKLNNFLERNKIIAYLLLFFISLAFFSWLQFSPTFGDPDSYYHVEAAVLISQHGFIRDFPYLQFTTLKDNYIDHHLLYHLWLVPFVNFFPPLIGAKIAHVILDILVVLVFFWLLVKLRVKGAFWYAIFLFFCQAFIFRISLVKAQPLSLIILFLGIYFIFKNKYWPLMALSFVYVWAYDGWFLLLLFAVFHLAVSSWQLSWEKTEKITPQFFLEERTFHFKMRRAFKAAIYFFKNLWRREHLKLFFAVLAGLGAGIVVNPYFPKNLEFFWVHIVQIAFVNYQDKIGVGAEWYPYHFLDFFKNTGLALVLAAVGLALFLSYRAKFNKNIKSLLLVLVFFFLATIKAKRNIEYLIPFAVVFAAMVLSAVAAAPKIKNELLPIYDFWREIWRYKLTRIFLSVVFIAAFGLAVYSLPVRVKASLTNGLGFDYLKPAAEFLKGVSQPGDLVFHSDWDDFPVLFYHNHRNYYIVGLDPTFMYLFDAELYHQWTSITQGGRQNNLADLIKNKFRAKYVLTTKDKRKFIQNLDNNFYFKKIYEDDEAIIYQVL